MSLAYFSRHAASAERTRERIRRTGRVAGQKLWTETEREKVKQLAPDYKALRSVLRGKTPTAIRFQCSKMGLTKTIHIWTGAELSKLRKLYPSASPQEICGAFPHSTWTNIKQAARYHGFRRKRAGYTMTGIPALDEVRKKCFEIGWTMADLDKAARTGTYFRRAGWSGKKISHRALGRAIEALDGNVMAAWKEYS